MRNTEQETICSWVQLFGIIHDEVVLCTDLSGKASGHSQMLDSQRGCENKKFHAVGT